MRISDWSSDVCSSDLDQQAAVDALVVPARAALGRPLAALEQAHVGFAGDDVARGLRDPGCDDHLDELALDDGLGGFAVQLAVEGDDAAKGRLAVGGVGQVIGLADAAFIFRYHSHAARVGMLDDYAGRLGKALHALPDRKSVGLGKGGSVR